MDASNPPETSTLSSKSEPPKVKLGRRARRAQTTLAMRANNKAKTVSAKRALFFSQLQSWLQNPGKLTQEQADLVFKKTLKKLFKNAYVHEQDFKNALETSIRAVKLEAKLATKTETTS